MTKKYNSLVYFKSFIHDFLVKNFSNGFLYPNFNIHNLFELSYIDRKSIYNFVFKASRKVNTRCGGEYKKGRFMDFGCGEKPYESLFEFKEYIGVDIKKSGHSNEKKKADAYYDGITIPFDDNYFDGALANQCFEHIYNIKHIISEINRVLKPGGILIITLPLAWEEHEIPYDFFRFTSYGIKNILNENNFKVITIKKLNSYKNAMRQLRIRYCWYKLKQSRKLVTKLKILTELLITTVWNNLMYEISKDTSDEGIFSTEIGVICKKIH